MKDEKPSQQVGNLTEEQVARSQEQANRARETRRCQGIPIDSCLLCDDAPVTVAYVYGKRPLVCARHHEEYAREGRRYLPDHERTFYHRLWDALCRKQSEEVDKKR